MRRCTTILTVCVALLVGCYSPRKASQRACDKAERLWVRAVVLCPKMLRLDSAQYTLPPVRVEVPVAYADSINYDSLLSACADLNAALLNRTPEPSFITAPPAAARPVRSPQNAVRAIRQAACEWEDITERFGRFTITVKNNGSAPPSIIVDDAGETRKVPCPPAVSHAPCPEQGVATWYRTFTWCTIGWLLLMLIVGIFYTIRNFPRGH